jgi:SAM-dependent methyltransferase
MSIVNRDQADHWNDDGVIRQWVTHQERYDTMLAPFADMLITQAALASGDRVLDVGCGCGATTIAAARAVRLGLAHGVDLSAAMLERARSDAATAGLANISFKLADAQVNLFAADSFDVVISRFGIMFFADPVAAFANIRSATRRGGRVVFVCWQALTANPWLLVPGSALATVVPLPDPGPPDSPGMFAFGDPDRIRDVLSAAGWLRVSVTERHLPILVGGAGTLDEAVEFLRNGTLGRSALAGVGPSIEARALNAVRTALAPHADRDGVRLEAGVWLVTAQNPDGEA